MHILKLTSLHAEVEIIYIVGQIRYTEKCSQSITAHQERPQGGID